MAKGDNPISNNFLRLAAGGFFPEHLKHFIENASKGNIKAAEKNITQILKTGATSGADMLTGFILCFRYRCRAVIESTSKQSLQTPCEMQS